jgi:hypothetical protein
MGRQKDAPGEAEAGLKKILKKVLQYFGEWLE